MTPEQLRMVAMRLRARYPAPDPRMTPGRYVSSEAMHALADALDEQARDEDDLSERGPE